MRDYIVRGPNWRIDVELSEDIIGDKSYMFYEAATQAIELIYRSLEDKDNAFFGEKRPKLGQFIQVALKGYDINSKDPELLDLMTAYIESGLVHLIPSDLILANAGKYSQAEFLKNIIENED